MIDLENANTTIDQLTAVVAELGIAAADLSATALNEPMDARLSRLEDMGAAMLLAAQTARAVLRLRTEKSALLPE